MFKRFIAIVIALLFCLCAVGCAKSDVPDGMKLASLEGEPFKLYVPKSWTVNTASGISGAFFAGTDNIAVSARYQTPENASASLEDYVDGCILSYTQSYKSFGFDGNVSATVLGGADARELSFTAEYQGKSFTFRQLFAERAGDIITLTFRCPTDLFANYNSQFDEIVKVFVLCDKGEVKNDCVTDKKTPDGMKIASNDAIEYRFYVPKSWICDSESGVSSAYYPESGKPNVTVTAYIPDEEVNVEEYFKSCEERYKVELEGYEFLTSSAETVAGRGAISYTYRVTYGESSLKIMQTVFSYNGRMYSITYTAHEDAFAEHLSDVERMLDAFRFR